MLNCVYAEHMPSFCADAPHENLVSYTVNLTQLHVIFFTYTYTKSCLLKNDQRLSQHKKQKRIVRIKMKICILYINFIITKIFVTSLSLSRSDVYIYMINLFKAWIHFAVLQFWRCHPDAEFIGTNCLWQFFSGVAGCKYWSEDTVHAYTERERERERGVHNDTFTSQTVVGHLLLGNLVDTLCIPIRCRRCSWTGPTDPAFWEACR